MYFKNLSRKPINSSIKNLVTGTYKIYDEFRVKQFGSEEMVFM